MSANSALTSSTVNSLRGRLSQIQSQLNYVVSSSQLPQPGALEGISDFVAPTDSEFRLLNEKEAPRSFRDTSSRSRRVMKPIELPTDAATVLKLSKEELGRLESDVITQIIEPTIRTEWAAVEFGIGFYVALGLAVVAVALIGHVSYATLAAFAVGTGGAVVYLQSFEVNVVTFLRTRRMLLNVQEAWKVEGDNSGDLSLRISNQIGDLLDQVSKMPQPYGPGAGTDGGK